jgi:hypothetical protein
VKLKVVHQECGREILVQQLLETGGHCPWDGRPLNRDYTGVLVEALETAQNAGTVLESALEEIAGMRSGFTLDRTSVLGPLSEQLDRLDERRPAATR